MHSTKRPPLQAELPTFYVFAACSDCLLGCNTKRSRAAVAKKAGRWNAIHNGCAVIVFGPKARRRFRHPYGPSTVVFPSSL
jgi:hypothetical protein